MDAHRILIVDDEESIRKLLANYLTHRGFATETAADGKEALERLDHTRFDLILSDVRMPRMGGLDLLAEVRKRYDATAVVMLSGCDDVKLAVQAMQRGALDYIVKPFHVEEVFETLRKALVRQHEAVERDQRVSDLEAALRRQTEELAATLSNLHEASETTLHALVAALDAREHETQAHSQRVSEYAVHLASGMGVGDGELDVIRRGSLVHDIGKIGIPDTILLKPDRLTDSEWAEMRKHPQIGHRIVSGVKGLGDAAGIVLAHHERFDGHGYPKGLARQQIPFGARVFSVVDTYDAMTSDRPYRRGCTYGAARDEILRESGRQFDPEVVGHFMKISEHAWEDIREQSLRTASTQAGLARPLAFTS